MSHYLKSESYQCVRFDVFYSEITNIRTLLSFSCTVRYCKASSLLSDELVTAHRWKQKHLETKFNTIRLKPMQIIWFCFLLPCFLHFGTICNELYYCQVTEFAEESLAFLPKTFFFLFPRWHKRHRFSPPKSFWHQIETYICNFSKIPPRFTSGFLLTRASFLGIFYSWTNILVPWRLGLLICESYPVI